MTFYHPRNAAMTHYGHSFRLWLLAAIAKALGITFDVGGVPFGASYPIRQPAPE